MGIFSNQQRHLTVTVIAVTFVGLWIAASYVSHPASINSVSSFDTNLGKRVRFAATFIGYSKPSHIILFDDTRLLMESRATGRFDWPKGGDTICVAGTLERSSRRYTNLEYVVRDASWTIQSRRSDQTIGDQ